MYRFIFLFLCVGIIFPFPSVAETVIPFEGQIDFVNKRLGLVINLEDRGQIVTEFVQNAAWDYRCTINVDHWVTSLFNISTVWEGSLSIGGDEGQGHAFQGKLESRYTLLNHRPIGEMTAAFEVHNQIVYLKSWSFGSLNGEGTIGLTYPFKTDLTLNLKDIGMLDFITFWAGDVDVTAEGLVSGKIQVSGSLIHPHLAGELSSYNGFVNELQFDSILLNLQGNYPILQLYNSTVSTTDGLTFNIAGSLNLKDRDNFEKQILALSQEPLVTNDSSQLEWTFKRIQKEKGSSTTELKYMHKKPQSLGSDERSQTDMLGVERSVQF